MNAKNAEGLEEGEIEDEVEERERKEVSSIKHQVRRKQGIRPNCDSDRVHSRNANQSKSTKRSSDKFKKLPPRPQRMKVETDGVNRQWPKTFVHRIVECPNLPGRCRPLIWEGHSRSPPRLGNQLDRYPWSRTQQYPRSRVNRPRSRLPLNNKKNSSHDEMSYEDLLAQYKEIQSQLEELNRQDIIPYSVHQPEDEILDKENLKNELTKKHVRNDDRHIKLKIDAKNRRRSRTRSLSSSRSRGVDPRSNQEEDDEQELRRIALASTRNRLDIKNSGNEKDAQLEVKHQVPLQSSEFGDNVNQQMYDNYEEVEMELDSNCESVKDDSDDEEELRRNVLLSLNQKQTKITCSKEKIPKTVSSDTATDSPASQQLDIKEIADDIPQLQIVSTPNFTLPVQPVVINLAEDSSDSEQEEKDSISDDVNRFLKEARQLSDAQQAVSRLSNAQVQEYCRLKVEIAKREQLSKAVLSSSDEVVPKSTQPVNNRGVIQLKSAVAKNEDEKELLLLEKALIQKKRNLQRNLQVAEQKVKRLQEQLAAAQKIVVANRNSMIKTNLQIKQIQKKIRDQKSELLNLNSNENLAPSSNKKRQLSSHPLQNNFKRTRLSVHTKNNLEKSSPSRPMTAKERADEKARLQLLEQEISNKLQELRRAKGLQQLPKPNVKWFVGGAPGDTTTSPNPKAVPSSPNKDNCTKESMYSVDPLTDKEIDDIKKIQEIKMSNILSMNVTTCRTVSQNKWDFLYFPIISKLPSLNLETNDVSPSDISLQHLEKSKILNPLLHLRSSRLLNSFTGHFSSSTYANKLDPSWILCSYDLMGTCNDDNCPRQHARDYSITPEEIIADLVSYCPQLCGLSEVSSVESSKDTIKKYAGEIFQKTSKQVSLEEICSQLVNEIGHHVPPGERLKTSPRPWKIEQDRRKKSATNSKEELSSLCHTTWDAETIALEENTRYFSMDNYQSDDLEAKLTEEPNNIQLWSKYANYYCNRKDGLSQIHLDRALHILSCALDRNRNSEELWLQYLALYRQHPDSGDFTQLCQQALSFVPSYELWWKHLGYTKEYKAKLDICKQIIDFVKNCQSSKEIISHRLLEIYLYQMNLILQVDGSESGTKMFKEILENNSEIKFLTGDDLSLAWLALIHAKLFHVLPSLFLDSRNDNPGRLINKVPILIMWQFCSSQYEEGLNLLNEAITHCTKHDIPLISIMPLYKNLVALYLAKKCFHLAEEVCQELIKLMPSEEDSWILLATVHSQKADYSGCLTTLQTAVNCLLHSPRIHFLGAVVAQQYISVEIAKEWLTRSIRNLLNTDQGDPVTLYKYILALPQPIDTQMPAVSMPLFSKDEPFLMYLWLSYCVFLQVDLKQNEIPDILEIALARITSTEPLQNIWLYYLHSVAKNLLSSPKGEGLKHWASLVRRCLTTVPTQIQLHNDFYYLQEFHVEVAEMLLGHMAPDHIFGVLDRLYSWLPQNSYLFLRYLKHLMKEENYQTVLSLVTEAVKNIKNVQASQLAIFAAQNILPNDQICSLYQKLISTLPYSTGLLEDALTSMEILGIREGANQLRKCSSSYLDDSIIGRLLNIPKENQVITKQIRMDPPSRS